MLRGDKRLLSQHYSVAGFVTLRFLSCLHSSQLRCLCCNFSYNITFDVLLELYCLLTNLKSDGIVFQNEIPRLC